MPAQFVPQEPELTRIRDAYQARVRDAIEIATLGQVPNRLGEPMHGVHDLVVAADQWENFATVWFIPSALHSKPVDEHVDLMRNGTRWEFQSRTRMDPGTELAPRACISEIDDQVSSRFFIEDIPYGSYIGGGPKTRRYATVQFQVATEVKSLHFDDRQQRQVADHGYCLVSYDPKHPPSITALGDSGVDFGSFTPRRTERRSRTFGLRSLRRR